MQLTDLVYSISTHLEEQGFQRAAINYVDNGIVFVMTKENKPYLFSIHLPKIVIIKESGIIETKKPLTYKDFLNNKSFN